VTPPLRAAARRPTLATIAEVAGVSVATVSKVVNGRDDVSADTRARVEGLLIAHDYGPVRRAPATAAPTTSVQFLVDGDFSSYSTAVMEGVVLAAAERGTAVAVGQLRPSPTLPYPTAPRRWAADLAAHGRTGLVVVTGELTGKHVDALAEAGVAVVVIDPLHLPRREVASVGSTNFIGGLSVTRHLLDLGHRRIAYLGGPPGSTCNQARLAGFRAAMDAAGVDVDPQLVRSEDFRFEVGRRLGAQVLDLDEPPTAVVGGSDPLALGVIEAAHSRGLRVPDDLSVTGFDDTELAPMAAPALTTVRQPLREMGRVALQTVLRLAAREPLASHHVELATELVVRGSTAGPAMAS
jgi:LacI family transcriptional regulator